MSSIDENSGAKYVNISVKSPIKEMREEKTVLKLPSLALPPQRPDKSLRKSPRAPLFTNYEDIDSVVTNPSRRFKDKQFDPHEFMDLGNDDLGYGRKRMPPRPHNKIFNSVDYQKPVSSMRKMKLANRHIYAYDDRNENTIQNDDAAPYISYNAVGPDHPAIYRSHRKNNRSDMPHQTYGKSLTKTNSERVLFNASEISLKDARWKQEPVTNTNMNIKKSFLS